MTHPHRYSDADLERVTTALLEMQYEPDDPRMQTMREYYREWFAKCAIETFLEGHHSGPNSDGYVYYSARDKNDEPQHYRVTIKDAGKLLGATIEAMSRIGIHARAIVEASLPATPGEKTEGQ